MVDFKLLNASQIDSDKWNDVVFHHGGGIVYSCTWYLNAVTGGKWKGLVFGDYDAVAALPYAFPVLWHFKINRPALVQQLGIIGPKHLLPNLIHILQLFTKEKRLKGVLSMNEHNEPFLEHLKTKRTNMLLPLDQPYEVIRMNYSKKLRNRINHYLPFVDVGWADQSNVDLFLEKFVTFTLKPAGINGNKLIRCTKKLINIAFEKNIGKIVFLYKDNQVIAGKFFLQTALRVVLLCSWFDKDYAKYNCQGLLTDALIKTYAGTQMTLDFEGSDIPGVFEFYVNFNPQIVKYTLLDLAQWR